MKKIISYIILLLAIAIFILSLPQFFNLPFNSKNESKSIGTRSNGKLENSKLLPYQRKNFKYFSWLSYYIMDNGYLHSKVHNTLLAAYKICERTCPSIQFKVMECANKEGGKMLIHRTHQTGMSVDFMVPKIRKSKPFRMYDNLGMWHYLLNFDKDGNLNKNVSIDFETMAKHILALDQAARKNGLTIERVILKINLKDDLFKTESGKKLLSKGIYFAQALQPSVDVMHDDHYHIDFKEI